MSKKSLTLLEIIISVVILALVAAGTANLFFASKRWLQHSGLRMSGAELTKYFLEPLQTQVRQDEWGTNCLGTGNCLPQNKTIGNRYYQVNYTVTPLANITGTQTSLSKVKIGINWEEEP